MNPKLLLASLSLALLLAYCTKAKAQNIVTTFFSQEGQMSFKIEKPSFEILLSPKGKIMGYAIKTAGNGNSGLSGYVERVGETKIDYDLDGRVKQIGRVEISYDLNNRIKEIGTENISYDLEGRVKEIGSTKISYSFFNGNIESIGG